MHLENRFPFHADIKTSKKEKDEQTKKRQTDTFFLLLCVLCYRAYLIIGMSLQVLTCMDIMKEPIASSMQQ